MRCAVSIITGAGLLLFLLAGQARAVPIEKTLYFQCVYPLIGEQPLTARIATDMPETQPVGEETGAFNLEVTATAEGNTYQGLTLVGAQTIEGIATAYSTVSGEGGLNLPIAVPLTIAQTDISGISGPFDIVATGDTPSLTFSESNAGQVDITVDSTMDMAMIARKADGTPIDFGDDWHDPDNPDRFIVDCVMDDDRMAGEGLDNLLHSFAVIIDDTGTEPAISVAPENLDFGQVITGLTGTETITLSNTGDAPLMVSSMMLSGDHATDFSHSGECATLEPGTDCDISLTFAPSATGPRTASLDIQSNDSDNSLLQVALAGEGASEAEPSIGLGGTTLLNFGQVQTGLSEAQDLVISNSGSGPLTLSALDITGSADFALVEGCDSVAPGSSCAVSVAFSPSGAGTRLGTLVVQSNDPITPTLEVYLEGIGTEVPTPSLSLSETSLAFADVELGQSSDMTLLLGNSGNAELQITGATLGSDDQGAFDINTDCDLIPTNQECPVTVTFTPVTQGSYSASLTIESNDADTPSVVVPLSGQGVPLAEAEVSVSPLTLDFGQVQVGNDASDNVLISNSGTAALTVMASVGGTDSAVFSHDSSCGTVGPGEDCELMVSFFPGEQGEHNATLTLGTNDPDTPTVNVALSGQATPQPEPQISLSPLSLAFGELQVGDSQQGEVTITNEGEAALAVSSIAVTGNGYTQSQDCADSVAPLSACTITVTFAPTTSGSFDGSLIIESDDADEGSLSVALSGSAVLAPAPNLSLNTDVLAFAATLVGETLDDVVILTNTGSAALAIDDISLSGSAAFTQSNDCGGSLSPSATCTVSVVFKPSAAGEQAAILSIQSSDGDHPQMTVAVSGEGQAVPTPSLTTNPGQMSFGALAVGNTLNAELLVINDGNVALDVASTLSGSDANAFARLGDSECLPLQPGEQCSVTVSFTPLSAGAKSAALQVGSAELGEAVSVALSGEGIGAGEGDTSRIGKGNAGGMAVLWLLAVALLLAQRKRTGSHGCQRASGRRQIGGAGLSCATRLRIRTQSL